MYIHIRDNTHSNASTAKILKTTTIKMTSFVKRTNTYFSPTTAVLQGIGNSFLVFVFAKELVLVELLVDVVRPLLLLLHFLRILGHRILVCALSLAVEILDDRKFLHECHKKQRAHFFFLVVVHTKICTAQDSAKRNFLCFCFTHETTGKPTVFFKSCARARAGNQKNEDFFFLNQRSEIFIFDDFLA